MKALAYLDGEFAATLATRGRQGVESVHLLHLLLPHPTQGVGGDVKVGQFLQEDREELILLHLHWRERGGANQNVTGIIRADLHVYFFVCDNKCNSVCDKNKNFYHISNINNYGCIAKALFVDA